MFLIILVPCCHYWPDPPMSWIPFPIYLGWNQQTVRYFSLFAGKTG